jgi:hypothetical protein
MNCLCHPSWLDHSNYTWRRVQVMKLLIMQYMLNVTNTCNWTVCEASRRYCWREQFTNTKINGGGGEASNSDITTVKLHIWKCEDQFEWPESIITEATFSLFKKTINTGALAYDFTKRQTKYFFKTMIFWDRVPHGYTASYSRIQNSS